MKPFLYVLCITGVFCFFVGTNAFADEAVNSDEYSVESVEAEKTEEATQATIVVGEKEAGFKIYMEFGGGTLGSLGVIYRFNPIFGVGIGAGFNPEDVRNTGFAIVLKAETIPIWFNLSVLKINLVMGIQTISFVENWQNYIAANLGAEFYFMNFGLLTPSVHSYWYMVGESVYFQLGIQLRFNI